MKSIWLGLVITTLITFCSGYKIMVVFPIASRSHSILGDRVVSLLAKTGHEVTYLTPFPKGKGPANVREIDLSHNIQYLPDHVGDIKQYMNNDLIPSNVTLFFDSLKKSCIHAIEHKEIQEMMYDPNVKFDVIIIEWIFLDYIAGLSAVFDCPYIWLSSSDPHRMVLQLAHDAPNPAYTTDAMSPNMPPLSFFQRAQELLFYVGGILLQYFVTDPILYIEYDRLLVPAIKKRGYPVPPLEDIIYNASLVLSNSHPSMGKSIPLPQNFKPVGGFHINREVKPLPEDLQKLLDGAKHGLIYFSMGSNLKSRLLPDELKKSLLKMFGGLKYTILWKFEEDLPGTPSNVHIVNWAPQQSILAHPNCVLFITHGGQLSTTETVHFGKPIVAIPAFADQHLNAARAVHLGFAKKVQLSFTMAGDIKKAIEEILGDPKYAARAKELSVIYHDRPVTPDKELVHWVEHVVKTRGAPHLRSPALDLSWYQKIYLDFAAFVLIVLIVIVTVVKRIISTFRGSKVVKKKRQ
ncbi:UDP-glycosyltransferase UGT5-like [Colias croceus]|uniref:UDP-glycosyltransferase UGT5-like n=1 Tax=Colias crocea TaxID=72248 RepID=UPI001E27FDAF|nr:UDP-glycosyltransferase UGT5-like [Colias croceus]XP_045503983.1 UDP-glycosyltransferase UGT5-like [Colias croceus]